MKEKISMRSAHGAGWRGARFRRLRDVVVAASALLAVLAPAAQADQDITALNVDVVPNARTPDPTQAGAHPDLDFEFELAAHPTGGALETPRKLVVDLPPGLVADPSATPQCSRGDARKGGCAFNTLIGLAEMDAPGGVVVSPMPVHNVSPAPNEAARISVHGAFGNIPLITLGVTVTPDGNYAIRARSDEFYGAPFDRFKMTLWGFPNDNNFSGAPPKAFITNPSSCASAPSARLAADSLQNPDVFDVMTDPIATPTGCDGLEFNPGVRVTPASRAAGNAAGVTVDVTVDQNDDPVGREVSTLKDAVVTLPEGLTINPGLGRDLSACDDGAFGKNSGAPASCHPGSKIGTAGILTPLLADPIPGDVYVAQPKPGQLFRLFVYAAGHGVRVKLEGDIRLDPQTGRITASFANNPQLPFSALRLNFQGGNRAVLALPETCGSKATSAAFAPWSGRAAVGASSAFTVYADEQGAGCSESAPFAPQFVAGTTSAIAGADTGFSLTFSRRSNEQQLKNLNLEMPAGLLGRLAAFPLCGTAQAQANRCSEDSMVGGVTASAGAGDSVLNLPGRVFLTEPFQAGQIAGLSIVVPAKVGPYDLGTVIVRAGIKVNRDTSLSVASDPFPTILEGIPLRLRQITVNLDRPGFMFNPTDCSPKAITGSLTSVGDASSPIGSPFQVQGCGALPFAPEVKMSTVQPARSGGTTGLHLEITPRAGDANMRVVDLVMPRGMGARLDGPLQNPCKPDQLAAEACPPASLVGTARAVTPILPEALSGNVYLLENGSGGALPRLAILLRGAVPVDLIGDITIDSQGRLVAHVPGVPDVPISSFTMDLATGEQAVLTAAGLCNTPATAYRSIVAHSGKRSHGTIPVQVEGCSAASKSKSAKKVKGKKGKKGKRG